MKNGAIQNPGPLRPVNAETDNEEMTSGAEPESSNLNVLGDLRVINVTSTSVSLAWSASDEAFDSFLVELSASSGATQAHVTTLPGNVRKAEVEGLSPSSHYDITLQGMVEGKPSVPLKVLATTGTGSQCFIFASILYITYSDLCFSPNMSG